eukprot:jgi/Orpsp1_1/1181505/evm.model.c7180000077429.1
MNKLIAVLLFCVYILKVSAVSTFIEKGQRPEIFELTDNDIAVFRITLPDEDFNLLKEKANVEGITPAVSNLTLEMDYMKQLVQLFFGQIFFLNYTEILSDKDVDIDLSGLFIRPDGYPDVEKIIENIDFDPKHYIDFDFAMNNLMNEIFVQGNYNYLELMEKISLLVSSSKTDDPELTTSIMVATKIIESTKENLDTEIKPLNNILSNSTVEEVIEQQDPTNDELLELLEAMENANKFKTKNGSLSVNIA